MLSGEEILNQIEEGNIIIEPFNAKQVNPNSYNVTLGKELIIYMDPILDCKKENRFKTIQIPEEGYTLLPGNLYLASTNEYTETYNFIPQISGRSSIGRVGLSVHISAGFGNNGYKGKWTLTMSCSVPVKVYPKMEIGQIYYFPIVGPKEELYQGKYDKKDGIHTSKMFLDSEFKSENN